MLAIPYIVICDEYHDSRYQSQLHLLEGMDSTKDVDITQHLSIDGSLKSLRVKKARRLTGIPPRVRLMTFSPFYPKPFSFPTSSFDVIRGLRHVLTVRSANALPPVSWVYATQFLNPEAFCNSTWM
jgi:hypothetical protein